MQLGGGIVVDLVHGVVGQQVPDHVVVGAEAAVVRVRARGGLVAAPIMPRAAAGTRVELTGGLFVTLHCSCGGALWLAWCMRVPMMPGGPGGGDATVRVWRDCCIL